jgi:resuscitation-promoting factor RpfA
MRLVCPNCEAKYEVPEDAIPDIGRDVQCANCGHSWFQMRPRPASVVAEPAPVAEVAPAPAEVASPAVAEPAPEAPAAEAVVEEAVVVADEAVDEAVVADGDNAAAKADDTSPAEDAVDPGLADVVEPVATAADDAKPVEEPAPVEVLDPVDSADTPEATADGASVAQPAEPELEPEAVLAAEVGALTEAADAEPEADTDPAGDAKEDDAAGTDPAPSAAAAAAYAVDESVLAILREEAEREAQARRAEARPLESQTDLGLDAAMPGKSKPVLVATNSVTADHDGDGALKPSARRDLLPDVEEINSTLRPSEVPTEDFVQPAPPPGEPRGFRSGFLMVMSVAIIGTAIYTAAPRLSVMVPALAGPLEAYVGAVDSLRLSLDGIMQSATVAINGI